MGFKLTIDLSTAYRRIKRLAEERKLPDLRLKPGGTVTVAVDSTGLKVGNYGEWMRYKWKSLSMGLVSFLVRRKASCL